MVWILLLVIIIVLVIIYDLRQKRHAILHNFPVIGHFRYLLESIGPELRQYIVTSNNEERPFDRDQRRWVYASAKKQNNYFGFGTDNDLEVSPNFLIIKHRTFPKNGRQLPSLLHRKEFTVPCAKIVGASRERKKAFRPDSIINLSAMSFGSLSANAVEAINRGCAKAGCLHNTGEGGIAPQHGNGADLIWQIGTGYFGCRNSDGTFSKERFLDNVEQYPVKAIELKLSQGAKPGRGGVLPGIKVTPEIAQIRGIPKGVDCISPTRHSAFCDVDSMLDFVEDLAEISGLPIGIKSAVGEDHFWVSLADAMLAQNRGVDFIAIDGGEGGTGAAPLVFSDHVALPFKLAFTRVYKIFAERGLQEKIVFIGSGKLGFPEEALFALGLGCDMVGCGKRGDACHRLYTSSALP